MLPLPSLLGTGQRGALSKKISKVAPLGPPHGRRCFGGRVGVVFAYQLRPISSRNAWKRGSGECTCTACVVGAKITAGKTWQPASKEQGKNLFCFGLGYTALGICNTLRHEGWVVSGTVRDERRLDALNLRGFPTHLWDPDQDRHLRYANRDAGSGDLVVRFSDQGLDALRQSTHILSTAPPGDLNLDPVLANLGCEIESLASLQWVGYLSTTGVYGDWGGEWVTEESPPRSTRPQMLARLDAEAAWLELRRRSSVPVHVFRLGGIYGPGRSVLDALARKGPPRESQRSRGQRRYTSRVHVADVCGAIKGSIERPCSGVYNVVDDDPAPRKEVVAYARGVAGVDPAVEEVDLVGGGSRTGGEEKRVRNTRAKRELGLELLFPTYREGIAAIASGDDTPFCGKQKSKDKTSS